MNLEEIKEWFYNDEELHEFQIEWLIEQAEKVEDQEKEIKLLKDELTKYILLYANEKGILDINNIGLK